MKRLSTRIAGRDNPAARRHCSPSACHTLAALALMLLPAAGAGCGPGQSGPFSTQSRALPAAVDPDRLRTELDLAMDRYKSQIISTVSHVSDGTADRRIRQVCLYWKIRALDNYLDIISMEDPRLAFMQEWFNVVRERQNLTEGTGKDLFGPDQHKIVAMIRGIEADILAMGRRCFSPAAIEDAQDDIESAASQYRNLGAFDPQPILAPEGDAHILAILALPLAPVAGLAGAATDTPKAINRFTDAARDFAMVVQHLPERTRWQSEVLLLEMEASGPVPQFTREMDLARDSLHEAVAAAQALPQQVREELERATGAIEKAQPQFQATLKQAGAVAQQAQSAAETTRQGLREFDKTAQSVSAVSSQLTQTAEAVQATAVQVRGVLADYAQLTRKVNPGGPGGGPKGIDPDGNTATASSAATASAPPSPDVQDYRAAAESFTAAAKEIRAVYGDLQQPLPPQAGVRQIAGDLHDVVDSLFWRAVLLAVVIFVLALLYRIIGRKMADKVGAQGSPAAKK